MAVCDVCGNDYDAAFSVELAGGERFTFDSLECAANRVAPSCAHCGCRILGHGVQSGTTIYCCAHCAEAGAGSTALRDREQ
jgi:hypothetical protein